MNNFKTSHSITFMGTIITVFRREFLALGRDRRTLVTLLLLPFLCIVLLGILLGEGFGQKPDDLFRVTIVDLDHRPGFDGLTWGERIRADLRECPDLKLELIDNREEAESLVHSHRRAAVIVLGPDIGEKIDNCSFLSGGINPFHREGVHLDKIGVVVIKDPKQGISAAVMEQVAQVSLMRVILPWMIGKAFERLGDREFIEILTKGATVPIPPRFQFLLGKESTTLKDIIQIVSEGKEATIETYREKIGDGIKKALTNQFSRYNLTGKTWASLVKANDSTGPMGLEESFLDGDGKGWLKRGAHRYQILVPSFLVLFLFFMGLPMSGTFVQERERRTWSRIRLAPVNMGAVLIGKTLPYLVLAIFQGTLLLLLGGWLLGMSWGGPQSYWLTNLFWLGLMVTSSSIAAVGLGLLVATLARTMAQVSMWGLLPSLGLALLGGCIIPRELFPEDTRWISLLTPHGWALDGFRELLSTTSETKSNLIQVLTASALLIGVGLLSGTLSIFTMMRKSIGG